jgi:hypothetical protein
MTESTPITPEEIRQQVEGRVVYSAERPIPFAAFLELSADRDVESDARGQKTDALVPLATREALFRGSSAPYSR